MTDGAHAPVPLHELRVFSGEAIVAGVKKVREDAPEIEVHKTRLIIQEEIPRAEHLLEGDQQRRQLRLPLFAVGTPLVDAAAPELPLLETEVVQLLRGRNKLSKVRIVQAKRCAFQVVVDVTPEDALQPVPLFWKESELELGVDILRDDLGVFIDLEDDALAVLDDRHLIVAFFAKTPDQGAVGRGNVDHFMARAAVVQDAFLDEAIGAPWDLNEFNHGVRGDGERIADEIEELETSQAQAIRLAKPLLFATQKNYDRDPGNTSGDSLRAILSNEGGKIR